MKKLCTFYGFFFHKLYGFRAVNHKNMYMFTESPQRLKIIYFYIKTRSKKKKIV